MSSQLLDWEGKERWGMNGNKALHRIVVDSEGHTLHLTEEEINAVRAFEIPVPVNPLDEAFLLLHMFILSSEPTPKVHDLLDALKLLRDNATDKKEMV